MAQMEKSAGITKIIGLHPLGTMNDCHGNPALIVVEIFHSKKCEVSSSLNTIITNTLSINAIGQLQEYTVSAVANVL